MATYPVDQIEAILTKTGTNSIRRRILPAFLIIYLAIVSALYADVSIRETLRIILEKLRHRYGPERIKIGVGSAITKARQRVGAVPLRELFQARVVPINNPQIKGCFWRCKLIVAVDGNYLSVQNTEDNRAYFGSHKNQYGETGYPILKWVGLGECGTHVIFACQEGTIHDDEKELLFKLIPKLRPDMLLLADRLYFSYHLWKACTATGCSLVWRVTKDMKLTPIKHFNDGSYLALIRPCKKLVQKKLCHKNESMTVRVIRYQVTFEDGSESETVRIITNLLDPAEAPAEELAPLYAERWHIETGFDEFKTHLKGGPRILRSQLHDLVLQEFYGFLLAYNVVRRVMSDAALQAGIPPVQLSFIHSLRIIKRKIAGSFFPSTAGSYEILDLLS